MGPRGNPRKPENPRGNPRKPENPRGNPRKLSAIVPPTDSMKVPENTDVLLTVTVTEPELALDGNGAKADLDLPRKARKPENPRRKARKAKRPRGDPRKARKPRSLRSHAESPRKARRKAESPRKARRKAESPRKARRKPRSPRERNPRRRVENAEESYDQVVTTPLLRTFSKKNEVE